jgi:drug/metabolite transporter (DMT)-like permease
VTAPFHLAGEAAGLTAAVLWALSSLAWHLSSRRVGSVAVTTIRIAAATVVLAVIHQVAYGVPWPTAMPARAQGLLALSGALGAGLGDLMLFRSFLLIGPRLGMLMLSLAPILTTLIAWFPPLHERLGVQVLAGIVITIGGVAWAVTAGSPHPTATRDRKLFRRGVALALSGSVCIGVAFAVTKLGLRAAGEGQAFAGTLIRVAAATLFCFAALPVTRQIGAAARAFRDARAMGILAAGVVVGPILGIWLSLVAFEWTAAGIASTLVGVSPVIMIPISWTAYGERPGWRGLIGTLLAVAGTAVLFLRAG